MSTQNVKYAFILSPGTLCLLSVGHVDKDTKMNLSATSSHVMLIGSKENVTCVYENLMFLNFMLSFLKFYDKWIGLNRPKVQREQYVTCFLTEKKSSLKGAQSNYVQTKFQIRFKNHSHVMLVFSIYLANTNNFNSPRIKF